LLQILLDSTAAVLVFLISARLLPYGVAVIAGLLVALSPHLAYYSLWLTADSICVPFILGAVYSIVLAKEKPRISNAVIAGVLLGLCCWIRTTTLLLSPFVAIAAIAYLERGKRLLFAGAIVASATAIVLPITIRNLIVFNKFAPVSIGSGVVLIEG